MGMEVDRVGKKMVEGQGFVRSSLSGLVSWLIGRDTDEGLRWLLVSVASSVSECEGEGECECECTVPTHWIDDDRIITTRVEENIQVPDREISMFFDCRSPNKSDTIYP